MLTQVSTLYNFKNATAFDESQYYNVLNPCFVFHTLGLQWSIFYVENRSAGIMHAVSQAFSLEYYPPFGYKLLHLKQVQQSKNKNCFQFVAMYHVKIVFNLLQMTFPQ